MTNRQLARMAKTVLEVIKPKYDEDDVLVLTIVLRIAYNNGELEQLRRTLKK